VLIDEVHTPESSRYWYADTYDELFRKNKDQRALDKEPLRESMVERGFRGDGEGPVMTDEVRIATATRYILLAEELTQRPFQAPELTAAERVANVLRDLLPAGPSRRARRPGGWHSWATNVGRDCEDVLQSPGRATDTTSVPPLASIVCC
jgi:SAICAR synthetase